jgi:hypothetical protein
LLIRDLLEIEPVRTIPDASKQMRGNHELRSSTLFRHGECLRARMTDPPCGVTMLSDGQCPVSTSHFYVT